MKGAGSSLDQILNLTVYLQGMRDFPTFHRVHERFFPNTPPALPVVEAAEVGHKGTLIEIEPTALRPGMGVTREILSAEDSPPAHMSLVVHAGGLLFLSGIAGLTAEGEPNANGKNLPLPARKRIPKNAMIERSPMALQALSILAQLERTLAGIGTRLDKIVHLTVFLKDIDDLVNLEHLFRKFFPRRRPAFTAVQAPRPAPVFGAQVSMTAIAWEDKMEPTVLN